MFDDKGRAKMVQAKREFKNYHLPGEQSNSGIGIFLKPQNIQKEKSKINCL